jgi:hypothetical protein
MGNNNLSNKQIAARAKQAAHNANIELLQGIIMESNCPSYINKAMQFNNGQAKAAAQLALNNGNWHSLAILALSQMQ